MSETMILRLPDVIQKTGISRSSIYSGIKAGTFPNHVALGPRAVGWRASDINGWLSSLTTKSHVKPISGVSTRRVLRRKISES